MVAQNTARHIKTASTTDRRLAVGLNLIASPPRSDEESLPTFFIIER
jgi:hypothetical protein